MSYDDINQRIEELHNVLVFCSYMQSIGRMHMFKVGERICINQERASLLTRLSQDSEFRDYKVSPSIEEKISFTLEKMNTNNWIGFSKDKFLK